MSRPRRTARRAAALAAVGACVAALALAGCSPAPTPTPTASPTPSPTPTATPTPTPTPIPAAYAVAYGGASFVGADDGLVEVVFALNVANTGEAAGVSVPVLFAANDGEAEPAGRIERLPGGETTEIAVERALPPGGHRVTFSVGESQHTEDVVVQAADVSVELLPDYASDDDGVTTFEARIANTGNAPAEDVTLAAEWTPRTGEHGAPGSIERAAVIEQIAPGGSETIAVRLPIPAGAYDLSLTAATASLEAVADDNAASDAVEVEYVRLVAVIETARTTGYDHDGNGVVEVSLFVMNDGVSPSGSLPVGVRCADGQAAVCDTDARLPSISPGGDARAEFTLALPQGDTTLAAYAGAPDDGYLWGARNTASRNVAVPHKPATDFVVRATAAVLGYQQNGVADVALALSFRNEGYRPAQDFPSLRAECSLHGEPVDGCGSALSGIVLPDGFGPVEGELRFSAPMGAALRVVLSDGAVSESVSVPERILGVDRSVWECFSDRPARNPTRENDFLGGCGGWTTEDVRKWPQDEPVRVWADPSGDEFYIDVLYETLDRLAPLLNLDFVWVDTAEDAALKAYVGMPRSRSTSVGFPEYCADAAGCAGPEAFDNGRITSASMSVWLNRSIRDAGALRAEIEHVTLHEALHAITDMSHRPTASSAMSVNAALRLASLSESDVALLRLHAHPLVRPGMTMAQVEDLIVFADELLDPPQDAAEEEEDDAVRIAERAYAAMIEAGSVRFRARGGWPGSGCDYTFSGFHETGRFDSGYPSVVHFDNNAASVFLLYDRETGWTGWREIVGEWRESTTSQVYDVTNWRLGLTDPVELLLNVITYAEPGELSVERPSGRVIRLDGTLHGVPAPSWASGLALRVSITMHAETHHISNYEQRWQFDTNGSSCSRYDVDATEGKYGEPINLPAAIGASS